MIDYPCPHDKDFSQCLTCHTLKLSEMVAQNEQLRTRLGEANARWNNRLAQEERIRELHRALDKRRSHIENIKKSWFEVRKVFSQPEGWEHAFEEMERALEGEP